MVFLKVKLTEKELFVVETRTDLPLDEVIRLVVRLYNRRLKLRLLVREAEQLKLYGRAKPLDQQGVEEEENDRMGEEDGDNGGRSSAGKASKNDGRDPTGRRDNQPPSPDIRQKIEETLRSARAVLSRSALPTTRERLNEAERHIKGAVMIAYPMGLPKYDSVEQLLYADFSYPEYHDPDSATLWFAGKELARDKKLMDNKSIGRNEKTSIVVKLRKRGQGAPVREQAVTEEEQRRLMAYWYKKQEEHKKLLEDEDDGYLNSEWADSKGLKTHFHGMGNGVSWKPTGR